MPQDISEYDGKKFCVVFVKLMGDDDAVTSEETANVQVRCLHGKANIERNTILHLEHEGGRFTVPASCYNRIQPSDGTDLLEDAEYFVMCRVSGMEL